MARIILAALLLVAIVATTVEGNDTPLTTVTPNIGGKNGLNNMWISRKLFGEGTPVLHPMDGTNQIKGSVNNMWISRRLLGEGGGLGIRPIGGTNKVDGSIKDDLAIP